MAIQTDDRMTSFQQAFAAHVHKDSALERLMKAAADMGINTDTPARVQCETCCDRGVISYDIKDWTDPRFGKFFPCPNPTCPINNARIQKRQAELLEQSHIPERYAGYDFKSWEHAARHRKANENIVLPIAQAWVDAPNHHLFIDGKDLDGSDQGASRSGLIFAGDFGTGKTGLMIAMAHALLERGEQALYIRAMDYFDVKYQTYRSYGDDENHERERDKAAVDTIFKAPILMLDDFNVSNGTANKQDVMEELIRYRHNHLLPMVITCNYSIPELEKLWGKRSLTALLEACHWIPFSGKPLRDTRQLGGAR